MQSDVTVKRVRVREIALLKRREVTWIKDKCEVNGAETVRKIERK